VTVIAEGVDAGVPAHHGDPLREQRVLASVAGVVDRSNRDVLIARGMTAGLAAHHLLAARRRPGRR